jgi:predicted component of type VI protein secretion system
MATATNRERVHTYLLIKGAGPAERVVVWDTQDISVGRAGDNDLALEDAALSRKHAEFYREGGAYAVKDLNTSNGTTVNGDTIRTHKLQNKDVVRIGDVEISFIQSPKNPAQIGKKVEFASQLKNFGGAAGQAKDGEATMLGLVQTLDGGDDDEDFVVGKMNDFGNDLVEMASGAKRQTPRDLDVELADPGADALPSPAAASAPLSAAHRIPQPAAAKAGPRLAPPGAPITDFDDLEEAPRPAARPQPRPAAPRAAAPAPAPTASAARAAGKRVSLQLEIEGLSGDLQRTLEALLGKVIELPPLRIRVKGDDL